MNTKNLIFNRIISNILQGNKFRLTNNSIKEYDYKVNFYDNSCKTKNIINSLSYISYNLYKSNISFYYDPPYEIFNGICKQEENDVDKWFLLNNKELDYFKTTSIIVNKSEFNYSYTIPCIILDKNEIQMCEEEMYKEKNVQV